VVLCAADIDGPLHTACTAPTEERPASAAHHAVTVVLHTQTHAFNGPFSGTTRVSRYKKGKTNLDFTEARDSISWAVCKSALSSRQTTTPAPQAGCTSCRPTNSTEGNSYVIYVSYVNSYVTHKQ